MRINKLTFFFAVVVGLLTIMTFLVSRFTFHAFISQHERPLVKIRPTKELAELESTNIEESSVLMATDDQSLALERNPETIKNASASVQTEFISTSISTKHTISKNNRIPKIVHFAIGFDSSLDGTIYDLQLFQYLAIKAARVRGKMDDVYLHYHFKPQGKWFDKSLKYITKLIQVPGLPDQIFNKTIKHFAHRKDVYLLQTLLSCGGVFADLDTIILRDLDDLLDYDVTMGLENYGSQEILVNAFVVARKNAFFLEKWLEEYKSFTNDQWNDFCCHLPKRLSKLYPERINVLSQKAVSTPLWTYDELKMAFLDRTYNYSQGNYVTHLWETKSTSLIRNLTMEKIWSIDTSLFCELRKLTADEENVPEMTDDMKENCRVVSADEPKNTSNRGLVGKWDLRNGDRKSLPKLLDSSGNRMHGILSPLFGYSQVNDSAFLHDDFMRFSGDHAYLPVFPGTPASKFTLVMWLRFPLEREQNPLPSFVSIECGNFTVCLEPTSSSCLRLVLYDSYNQSTLLVVGEAVGPLERDTWYLLSISCEDQRCVLRMEAACLPSASVDQFHTVANKRPDSTNAVLNFKLASSTLLGGIWLGRREARPKALWKANHSTDGFCDISDVRLYEVIFNHLAVLYEMSRFSNKCTNSSFWKL